jgi:hypothetical protein
MVTTDAGDGAEMRHARSEGSGRKPREQGMGASTAFFLDVVAAISDEGPGVTVRHHVGR